ncbi:ABC transporter substrate-binding protein [Deinococcus antarcticus]|uniref:ABC transporter substrate-binding protein n=1 Tax=Deinococcus antarcticus TaxID=1298767 RepID=A0ABV8A8Y4_9DEIO
MHFQCRVLQFKPGAADIVPSLATAWKNNADATVWTFTLRKGVKFHDGTPFNADAVLFNVNRWWNKQDSNRFGATFEIWPQLLGGNRGEAGSFVKSVTKQGDYTVIFTLNKSVTAFPALIGSYYFGIASPTAVKKQGSKYGTPAGGAVGTGPFVFQSWKAGDRLTMKGNTAYWGQKAKVDQLNVSD